MSDTSTNKFVGRGTTAQRLAFVPNPGTPTPTPAQGYTFWDTDTQRLYAYDFGLAAWVATSSGTAGTVTNTGTLTANRLLKGNGGVDVTVGDLTGEVTTAGTMATTIATDAVTTAKILNANVTLAKIANASANSKLLGSGAAGVGAAYSELTLGTGLSMSGTTLNAASSGGTRAITFAIDGGGVALTTGVKADVYVPYAATITAVTLLADQSGSVVVDIWKDTYANYPPVVGDSITASAKPTITTATKSTDSTLTGWTTSISAGHTLRFNIDSVSTITRLSLTLTVSV